MNVNRYFVSYNVHSTTLQHTVVGRGQMEMITDGHFSLDALVDRVKHFVNRENQEKGIAAYDWEDSYLHILAFNTLPIEPSFRR